MRVVIAEDSLLLREGLGRAVAGRELNPKPGIGREVAPLATLGTSADFGHLAAIAAENDDLVPLLNGFDELGEPCFRLVHVDGDHD